MVGAFAEIGLAAAFSGLACSACSFWALYDSQQRLQHPFPSLWPRAEYRSLQRRAKL